MEFITGLLKSMPGACAQGLIWGIMAIGVYITYKILDIADLTVDGSFCTGGAVCLVLVMNGVPMWLALLLAFVAGMIAGLITGFLHVGFGIPPILAGILTQLALYSINLRIMGITNEKGNIASGIQVSVTEYNLIVSQRYALELSLRNPNIIVGLFVIATIVVLYMFFGTEIGAALRATGSNTNMSRAQGINTNFAKVLGLMISNGFVALSGALFAQYNGQAEINMGRGAIVIGLAAVIIGEVLLSKIAKNFSLKLLGCVVGAIIYYLVIQIVLKLGLSTDDLKLLTALVVAIFLAVPFWKGKYSIWKKRRDNAKLEGGAK